jgi:hypothetical protein
MKKNKIMLLARKWIDLEIIMLSKISQTQKDKYHISFNRQNLDFKIGWGTICEEERDQYEGEEEQERSKGVNLIKIHCLHV